MKFIRCRFHHLIFTFSLVAVYQIFDQLKWVCLYERRKFSYFFYVRACVLFLVLNLMMSPPLIFKRMGRKGKKVFKLYFFVLFCVVWFGSYRIDLSDSRLWIMVNILLFKNLYVFKGIFFHFFFFTPTVVRPLFHWFIEFYEKFAW